MKDKTQPEALRLVEQYDYGEPATYGNVWKAAVCTELRRQHTRIAELEAELEAVGAGGVQALSAAPAGWRELAAKVMDALADAQDTTNSQYPEHVRCYPSWERHARWLRWHADMFRSGNPVGNGAGNPDVLAALAASPTPPAEQQAAPKAAPVELSADSLRHQNKLLAETLGACILASGIVRKDIDGFTGPELLHFGEDLRSMLEVAPKQEVQEPHGWLYEWTHSSATGKPDSTYTAFATDEAHARKHDNCRAIYTAPQPAPATQQAGATKEHVRLVRVIADKIEDGTLFRSGIYSNKDLARFVRNVADAAAPQFPTTQADSVQEDAARWHWMAGYIVGTRTDLDDELIACQTVDELRKLVDADLAAAQAAHIEKLQAKLTKTPSFAPQRVREG